MLHAVASLSTFVKVGQLALVPAQGGGQLEGPDEVVDFLEVGADGEDFVDDVFDARDAFGAQGVFDDAIVGQRNALFVDLAETTLVDQLTDGFQVGFMTN